MEMRRSAIAACVLNQGKDAKSSLKWPHGGNLCRFFYHPSVVVTELWLAGAGQNFSIHTADTNKRHLAGLRDMADARVDLRFAAAPAASAFRSR
jgi:hypothetical protein